jgi:hypothetical protein
VSVMQIVKKTPLIFSLLAFVVCVFISGCESRLFNNDDLVYSSMWGMDNSFSLDEMTYSIGDVSGSLKDCSSVEYPKCLIFSSTVIMLPKLEIFNKIEDSYYEGRNEKLGLNYSLREIEIKVLGEKIKGYMFYVGHSNEIIDDETMLGKLKGTYFYSMTDGVLFYEHNSEIVLSNQKRARLSVVNWNTTMCGFFSNKCK